MIWKEITIYTTSEAADIIADIFFDEGGNGVCITDKKDITDLYKSNIIWDYIDETLINEDDGIALVKGFVSQDCFKEKLMHITDKLNDLKQNNFFNYGSLEVGIKDVDDKDWFEIWKKHYKPIHIGKTTICPVWIKINEAHKNIVYIDPGLAFGTGEHETTSMCIELMQYYDVKGKTVIDIGCGSGILGVAALKAGAAKAYMSDIDLQAVAAAINCCKLNKVSEKAEVGKVVPAKIKGDIIFLNIVADVLISYAEEVYGRLNNGGTVILSGIIHSKIEEVVAAYKKTGLNQDKFLTKGEWCAVSFKKVLGD